MRVIEKLSDDQSVQGGLPDLKNPILKALQPRMTVRHYYGVKFKTENTVHHSFGWPGTGLGDELNRHHSNIINLHWVGYMPPGYNTLSIKEIGRLRKPVVWTLHDQWAFCGAEHYTLMPPAADFRYVDGYHKNNRPQDESGKDRNRLVWEQKMRYWKHPFTIICPSEWLASCAKSSFLMRNWPIHVIPYPVDTNKWSAVDQRLARRTLGLPEDTRSILFCADADSRKGADLLLQAMKHIKRRNPSMAESTEVVLVGNVPTSNFELDTPVRFIGRVESDKELHLHYVAADVIVIPSRQDNMPLTGVESHTCGTPAVAFKVGGLSDIITHKVTGALAEPFNSESLASEIIWVLEDETRRRELGSAARAKAETLWAPEVIAKKYCELYNKIIFNQIEQTHHRPSKTF